MVPDNLPKRSPMDAFTPRTGRGFGKVNSVSGYDFILTVIDGALAGGGTDKFRIKIWEKVSGRIIYDNEPGRYADDPITSLGTRRAAYSSKNSAGRGGSGRLSASYPTGHRQGSEFLAQEECVLADDACGEGRVCCTVPSKSRIISRQPGCRRLLGNLATR
jgi:hypothetical protein